MADEYIKLSELEQAVIIRQTEEKKYWFDWLKQFRTTKEYSVKEQAVDNFLRGYHEAVQFMLSTNEELLHKSADVVEVRHGEWLDNGDKDINGVSKPFAISCSVCGSSAGTDWMNYCPNCGADMRGETNG